MRTNIIKLAITLIAIGISHATNAQPSISQPVGMSDTHGDQHAQVGTDKDLLNQLLVPYLEAQGALAGDDLESARQAGAAMEIIITNSGTKANPLLEASEIIAGATNLKLARNAFLPISEILIASAKRGELETTRNLYLSFCPMAFNNKGGEWLQDEATLANPYFGSMMLRCGTIKPLE